LLQGAGIIPYPIAMDRKVFASDIDGSGVLEAFRIVGITGETSTGIEKECYRE
jgi:hypothetical protein